MQHHFTNSDVLIAHLRGVVPKLPDPLLRQNYTGLLCVIGVASYELCIKEIFCSFGARKHRTFGSFVDAYFDRINGRIRLKHIREEYLDRFGEKYRNRFDQLLDAEEKTTLRNMGKSVRSCYSNLITWRHQFAHEGQLPNNATFDEAVESFEVGKRVIRTLQASMVR